MDWRYIVKATKERRIVVASYLKRWRIAHATPIIILQIGKVGSSAVTAAIRRTCPEVPVFQLHVVSDGGVRNAVNSIRASANPFLDQHLIESLVLGPKLRKLKAARVITMTREPISRAISFVFQDLARHCPTAHLAGGSLDFTIIKKAIDDKLAAGTNHHDPSNWFDQEILDPFGIDVFSSEFDYATRTLRASKEGIDLLCVRMEDLTSEAARSALGKFLGLNSPLRIARQNDSTQKNIASSYAKFRSQYRVPEQLCGAIYATRYSQKFYGSEIETLFEKWSGRALSPQASE